MLEAILHKQIICVHKTLYFLMQTTFSLQIGLF